MIEMLLVFMVDLNPLHNEVTRGEPKVVYAGEMIQDVRKPNHVIRGLGF
jgi:hypothetical protein